MPEMEQNEQDDVPPRVFPRRSCTEILIFYRGLQRKEDRQIHFGGVFFFFYRMRK